MTKKTTMHNINELQCWNDPDAKERGVFDAGIICKPVTEEHPMVYGGAIKKIRNVAVLGEAMVKTAYIDNPVLHEPSFNIWGRFDIDIEEFQSGVKELTVRRATR